MSVMLVPKRPTSSSTTTFLLPLLLNHGTPLHPKFPLHHSTSPSACPFFRPPTLPPHSSPHHLHLPHLASCSLLLSYPRQQPDARDGAFDVSLFEYGLPYVDPKGCGMGMAVESGQWGEEGDGSGVLVSVREGGRRG